MTSGVSAAPAPPQRDPMRPLRRRAAVAWAAGGLSFTLVWAEHQFGVLHPYSLLFILLLIVTFAPAVGALVRGLWRLVRGPRRFAAISWTALSLVPALCWCALGAFGFHQMRTKDYYNNLPMHLVKMAGASLMEAQARYLYPHRLETERLVMFYGDDVTDPQGEAEVLDRHVARMEELTGLRRRTKTWWVRGRLLGQGRLCMYALALGSPRSPTGALDYHELAHSIFSQHEGPDADPPTLLMEGWAEAQSLDRAKLVRRALHQRRVVAEWAAAVAGADPEQDDFMRRLVDPVGMGRLLQKYRETGGDFSYLRELTDDFWYHHDNGPVYPVGGAFVDFLIRKYGAARFVELAQSCHPGTFEAECRRMYGTELDALEKEFWQDAEHAAKTP